VDTYAEFMDGSWAEEIVRRIGQTSDDLKRAVAAVEAEGKPGDWPLSEDRSIIQGRALLRLGEQYLERCGGDQAERGDHAVAALLCSCDELVNKAPILWAQAKHRLAWAYHQRTRGRKAHNIELMHAACRAALTVHTREAFPVEWAKTQIALAAAYCSAVGGLAGNAERAFAHANSALTVLTRETYPREWAKAQLALANAHLLLRGEFAKDIERAISHCEAALTVMTREALPFEWARAQVRLGVSYFARVHGERADNIERAISFYEAALTVLNSEAFPVEWANVRNFLATAYLWRMSGEAAHNIERAIALLEASSTLLPVRDHALIWAETRHSLAIAYLRRLPESEDNVERAIAHEEAALTVLTREDHPYAWAAAHHFLGYACARRYHGERIENDKRAITHYEAALTVQTPEATPAMHLETAQGLGALFLRQRNWDRAAAVLAGAREAFALLSGEGLEESNARFWIEVAGHLFANSAYVASELGRQEEAFELGCQGRARLLATALRQQRLGLSSQGRHRLEGLRREIREQSRLLELQSGTGRNDVLERLAVLRHELSGLIADGKAASGQVEALALAGPLVAGGDAIILPIVTEAGGRLFIVTGPQDGAASPRLTVRSVRAFHSRKLKDFIHGTDGSLGWLEIFARKLTRQRNALMSELSDDLWRLFAPSGLEGVIAFLLEQEEEWQCSLPAVFNELGLKHGARLMVLPTDGLGFLPLGLMRKPSSGRRLIDDYEIIYSPSLEALSRAHLAAEGPVAASLGAIINPTGDLPYTPVEGKLIAGEFQQTASVFLDQHTATPEAALAAFKGKTYWHFSTHGRFDFKDARRSALMMKDGAKLNVGTLMEAEDLGRPRLVVLSACESGLHEIYDAPDEFIGFPGAFMAMGAGAVLGTLWPVNDLASTLLVARFYELHRRRELPPPTALRQAQLWLRDARRSELVAYVETAAQDRRLDSAQTQQMKAAIAMVGVGLEAERFFDGIPEPPTELPNGDRKSDSERPFAHPIYWGGFILYGL
jgi:CHAT domain-containing protein/tetratricopeptide (TPR) repeat protein